MPEAAAPAPALANWAKVIDHTRCIGCHACTVACKSENQVPVGVTRTYVKYVDHGTFPTVRRAFQVNRCNMCAAAPCVTACPTSAMYRRKDGIVDFDKSACIGCKACIAACPYDAIFINPEDHSAEKCNFCAHRLDGGLEPACVVVCPTQAIMVGSLDDPGSRVAQLVGGGAVQVRRPEKDTDPRLFYRGASQVTLDPLAARRPDGGLYLWSEEGGGPGFVPSGNSGPWASAAAAQLAYDVPQHRAPWDWRVSLYTWTKSIAAGALLVPALLGASGWMPWDGGMWTLTAPLLGAVFLALTGVLLLADLEHPKRFWFLFTRPQMKSWLVRGAFIIGAYAAALGLHVLIGLRGGPRALALLPWLMAPLAAATAVYTAYLFAQAKGRDMWQSPLLPPHLLVQAILAGAAALMLAGGSAQADTGIALSWVLAMACAVHLVCVAGEATIHHPTAHARLAQHNMVRGQYAIFFHSGALLVAFGCAAPWLGMPAALLALGGLLAYEHAFVQAGQSVPLA